MFHMQERHSHFHLYMKNPSIMVLGIFLVLAKKIIFLISQGKHMLWYSLEVPQRGTSNEYHNIRFLWKK